MKTNSLSDNESFSDNYNLGDEIGRGGFSIVYKAQNKESQEWFAVKIIEKSLLQEDIKLLKREIDIMKKVNHKNVLKLHEIYEDKSKVYIGNNNSFKHMYQLIL